MTAERPGPTTPERELLAALCAALPALRERAEAGFWVDTLDMHLADLLAGESAVVVCARLDLTFDRPAGTDARGVHPGDAVADLWPVPSLVGDYHCPLRRCRRRAGRDDNGRPPRCWLTGEQMSFTSRDS
ncbi:hypothetical protein [Actinophytocola sediminis]